jgi:hypothetical protein
MNVSRTWKPMPDPCPEPWDAGGGLCQIRAEFEGLWHLAPHVASTDEPWDRWIPAEDLERIRNLVRQALPELRRPTELDDRDASSLRTLSAGLEDQAERCLRAPLVVRIGSRTPNQPPERAVEKWIMVLPVGAVMVAVVRQPARIYLATCFFKPARGGLDDPATRCRQLQDFYLGRYLLPGQGGLLPRPADLDLVTRNDETGTVERTRLRAFVTPANWGLDPAPPHAMVRPRINYTYPPEAVPGQTERQGPPGRKRRLRPRPPRPWDQDESGEITP